MIGKPIIVTYDVEEAWNAYKDYVAKTGFYARVDKLPPDKGETGIKYVVYGYDEPCHLDRIIPKTTHSDLREMAKHYLRLVKLKVASSHMIKWIESDVIRNAIKESLEEKAHMKRFFASIVEKHPIYEWCRRIRAGKATLGAVDALMFLGFIDPHEAQTGGRAKAYWGITPMGKLTKGMRAKGVTICKGIIYNITTRVLMGKDPYYVPYKEAKKEFLLAKYPESITVERGGKMVTFKKGEPGYMATIEAKARNWLSSLLISNAQQIIREAEGYSVPKHRFHIEPKPSHDATADPKIIDAIKKGLCEIEWKKA